MKIIKLYYSCWFVSYFSSWILVFPDYHYLINIGSDFLCNALIFSYYHIINSFLSLLFRSSSIFCSAVNLIVKKMSNFFRFDILTIKFLYSLSDFCIFSPCFTKFLNLLFANFFVLDGVFYDIKNYLDWVFNTFFSFYLSGKVSTILPIFGEYLFIFMQSFYFVFLINSYFLYFMFTNLVFNYFIQMNIFSVLCPL